MPVASELSHVPPAFFVWEAYDPSVKANLFSSAIGTRDGLYIVDPIPLETDALAELLREGPIVGIVVTNANHFRASSQFAQKFSVPIFARAESSPNEVKSEFRTLTDGDKICDELRVVEIDGAVAGEIVLHYAPNAGGLIVGDALINFEPYGFTFLPGKYCSDEHEMRRSLRKLLVCPAERMLFAHGTPLTSRAGERVKQLLESTAE